jgi:hypothetical protein
MRIDPRNMAKKEYFLYGGLFLIGAVFTPAVAALIWGGDRPVSESQSSPEGELETFATRDIDPLFKADEPLTATFAPEDDREQVLRDYEDNSAAVLGQIPAVIPQFAANQPGVPTYPNYWVDIRIPTFSSQPLNLSTTETAPLNPGDRPQNEVSAMPLSDSSNPQNLESFRTGPEEIDSTIQNQNRLEVPSGSRFGEFLNSVPAREITEL